MTIGERIEDRRKAVGIKSQAELARRAKMGQSTLNGLIRKPYRWSPYLVALARELKTTVEYLTGVTDDPDSDASLAPLPVPAQHLVTLQVALPSERALTRMFEALLAGLPDALPLDEQAQLLAQRLPIGLSQLRDVRPDPPTSAPPAASSGSHAAPATPDPVPTR